MKITQYTVKVVSSDKNYDENKLLHTIFASLYSIRGLLDTVNPAVSVSCTRSYLKMILSVRDMPIFEQLRYKPVKSPIVNAIICPQYTNYAQMILWKEKIVIA